MKLSNISIFRDHLREVEVFMEEVQPESDDGIFFRVDQSMKNGGNVLLVVSFSKDGRLIDLNVFKIAKITDVLKREEVHKFLNKLNADYRYAKFIEVDGNISMSYSLLVEENELNPHMLLNRLIGLLDVANDEYPNFMKLQWT